METCQIRKTLQKIARKQISLTTHTMNQKRIKQKNEYIIIILGGSLWSSLNDEMKKLPRKQLFSIMHIIIRKDQKDECVQHYYYILKENNNNSPQFKKFCQSFCFTSNLVILIFLKITAIKVTVINNRM